MVIDERLDRQRRIEGWNQEALDNAKLCVIGDDKVMPSMFAMSAGALGINDITLIAPAIDERLMEVAKKVNPQLNLTYLQGYYTHRELIRQFVRKNNMICDFSNYSLVKKLLIEISYFEGIPVLLSGINGNNEGRIYTYSKGREGKITEVLPERALPYPRSADPILPIIFAGMALDEVKNQLMGKKVTKEIIRYNGSKAQANKDLNVLLVGAGALGNFVALGLGYLGIKNIDIIDADDIEATNLNRQVLFFDSVGKDKAPTLAERVNSFFGVNARGVKQYFRKDTDISKYDVVFDCVDNHETRILTSEKCKESKKKLISGGTNYMSGQTVCYNPDSSEKTPAELLGLYALVEARKAETYVRDRASCIYQPTPSVIMTNQVIAGVMVDRFRELLINPNVGRVDYETDSEKKIVGY
jgi:molybdopterin/thiamine biosynthesis adenylyltransferase